MTGYRLHLGCGRIHRPGWINLDRYVAPAADLRAEALRLPFPGGCAQALAAYHLLEHLGYAGARFAFYEWSRVLAPGGLLTVETPDRSATLLRASETPEPLLPWLFGDERRGWRHRYLFNAEELAQLAVQAGFVAVTATPVGENPERPSLLLRATRAPDTPGVDFAIRFHGLLLARGVVDPDDAPAYLAAVETICTDVLPLLTTPGEASLLQLFSMAARYSPEVAACALAALPERGRWPAEMLATADALVATLQATHFTARLACRWRTLAPASFQTRAPWATLEREISLYLAACLYPNEGLDDIRGTFERVTGRRHPADARLRIFTREALAELARDLTAEGVRVFAHGRLDVARDAFETALSYDAGLLWPRWNLARICRVQGRVLEALEHYEALQHDLPVIFRPAYEQELDALSDRAAPPPGSDGPLVDPRDLVEAGS